MIDEQPKTRPTVIVTRFLINIDPALIATYSNSSHRTADSDPDRGSHPTKVMHKASRTYMHASITIQCIIMRHHIEEEGSELYCMCQVVSMNVWMTGNTGNSSFSLLESIPVSPSEDDVSDYLSICRAFHDLVYLLAHSRLHCT